jgi:hypothetical protein
MAYILAVASEIENRRGGTIGARCYNRSSEPLSAADVPMTGVELRLREMPEERHLVTVYVMSKQPILLQN